MGSPSTMMSRRTPVLVTAVLAGLSVVGCGSVGEWLESTESNSTYEHEEEVAGGDVGAGRAARVERVVDGDSIEVAYLDDPNTTIEVRLRSYNAPELRGPDNRTTCQGEASKLALQELVADASDGTVSVIGEEIDRYGRTLADLDLGRFTAVARLVADGHGLATGEDGDRAAMRDAAERGVGLWGERCGRPEADGLVIADAQPNPPGSDRDNLADEWVAVANRGDGAVDLDGWIIRDDTTGHRFPLRGRLDPGARLLVRSGSGRSDDENLYLDESFPVWSNQGETVLVVDPKGVVATWAFLD